MAEAAVPARVADRRALLGLAGLVAVAGLAWATGLVDATSWASFQARRGELEAWVAARPVTALAAYVAAYVGVAGASLPIAAPLTLVGGALFGFLPALVAVSAGSTAGAIVAFLSARWLFADAVRRRLGAVVDVVDRGLDEDGAAWLLAARLVPVLPFFAVNLAVGLTRVPLRTYAWTSLVGMLPGTAAYVWAGTRLGAVRTPGDLLSPGLWAALAVLGVLPLVTRRALAWRRGANAPRRS